MTESESSPEPTTCQAVSRWDEPCEAEAEELCGECGLWFCEAHFSNPDWHPCMVEN
jgi:hypothetical protein